MVIMALDHIRDFFHVGAQRFSPEDLTQTDAALFFTRWITHFCAPVFVFLAGASAYLASRRGMNAAATSRLLWTRGLWLIVIEMTLVLLGGTFNFSYDFVIWQVIWAIGWSMIALSVLMFLPWRALLAFSVAMIALHNTLDGVTPEQFSSFGWLWKILHVGLTTIQLSERHVILVIYPLIPWIGVMSAGYCFGKVFDLDADHRRRLLLQLGTALTAGFVVLRLANIYGDPSPWAVQSSGEITLLSFLRTSKYPPSLDYLLMTLGPAIAALGLLDRVSVGERNPFLVFGRVPFFFYVIHWYVLHSVALGMAWMRYGRVDFLFGLPPSLLPTSAGYPPDYGYDLWVVYLIWAAIVAGLYPICWWFARLKARHRSMWLSYL
jgi:uncharacterized membrane protein